MQLGLPCVQERNNDINHIAADPSAGLQGPRLFEGALSLWPYVDIAVVAICMQTALACVAPMGLDSSDLCRAWRCVYQAGRERSLKT